MWRERNSSYWFRVLSDNPTLKELLHKLNRTSKRESTVHNQKKQIEDTLKLQDNDENKNISEERLKELLKFYKQPLKPPYWLLDFLLYSGIDKQSIDDIKKLAISILDSFKPQYIVTLKNSIGKLDREYNEYLHLLRIYISILYMFNEFDVDLKNRLIELLIDLILIRGNFLEGHISIDFYFEQAIRNFDFLPNDFFKEFIDRYKRFISTEKNIIGRYGNDRWIYRDQKDRQKFRYIYTTNLEEHFFFFIKMLYENDLIEKEDIDTYVHSRFDKELKSIDEISCDKNFEKIHEIINFLVFLKYYFEEFGDILFDKRIDSRIELFWLKLENVFINLKEFILKVDILNYDYVLDNFVKIARLLQEIESILINLHKEKEKSIFTKLKIILQEISVITIYKAAEKSYNNFEQDNFLQICDNLFVEIKEHKKRYKELSKSFDKWKENQWVELSYEIFILYYRLNFIRNMLRVLNDSGYKVDKEIIDEIEKNYSEGYLEFLANLKDIFVPNYGYFNFDILLKIIPTDNKSDNISKLFQAARDNMRVLMNSDEIFPKKLPYWKRLALAYNKGIISSQEFVIFFEMIFPEVIRLWREGIDYENIGEVVSHIDNFFNNESISVEFYELLKKYLKLKGVSFYNIFRNWLDEQIEKKELKKDIIKTFYLNYWIEIKADDIKLEKNKEKGVYNVYIYCKLLEFYDWTREVVNCKVWKIVGREWENIKKLVKELKTNGHKIGKVKVKEDIRFIPDLF